MTVRTDSPRGSPGGPRRVLRGGRGAPPRRVGGALRGARHGRLRRAAGFHRDESGGAIDYVLVLGVFCVPIIVVLLLLADVLADYFGMIAFYVSWPFM